jgi:integrase
VRGTGPGWLALTGKSLTALSIYDFDEQRRTVLIRHGKGDKARAVPVGERAGLWIRKYLDEARGELVLAPDDGTLFLGHLGEPLRPDPLSANVRAYIDKAEIKKPGSCHLFRHTAAVLMLEHGADYYADTLKQSPEAQAYLRERRLVHGELLDKFKVGFSNRSLGPKNR